MASHDYERITRAINYLERHRAERPSLEQVSREVGLSPFHFQRLFRRWAGISPKRFVQFQMVEHAKEMLAQSRNLLEATYAAGLTSQGRLHDLFVKLEAVTPGEYRARGAGLRIVYGVHPSPFGPCFLALTDRGICSLQFVRAEGLAGALRELKRAWPKAVFRPNPARTKALAEQIFSAALNGKREPLSVLVRGTNFQVQVWRALLRIPAGAVASYEDVAVAAGRPQAVRAAASAVANNPVAYLIPCHRVIRKSGDIGNYAAGPERKRAMLTWEMARTEVA
jgi:AraC family transcriptional regulator, regulatory protein of adaptative response / methylated-DNA-[protein]-cysteine methyltransferase